jgi:hypothetical protein
MKDIRSLSKDELLAACDALGKKNLELPNSGNGCGKKVLELLTR